MAETPPIQADRHCGACGAVLYEGAAWCGMCFAPVVAEPDPVPRTGGPARVEVDARSGEERTTTTAEAPATAAMWPCPVCESKNPIDRDFCDTCGASFAALMRQEASRPTIDPRRAFRRSLLLPGLGHSMMAGRQIDGFARGVLFAMLLIATLMLGFSGVHAGAVFFLFLIYLGATVFVYFLTAFEASRLADGGEPLVASRTLLWATVGILLLSIAVVSLVIGTAARR